MNAAKISLEDRQALYDNLSMYAWCLDQADGSGVASTFTSDGVIITADARWEGPERLRAFVANASSQPGFFGRQHHVQPLFIEEEVDGNYVMTSYWMVVTSHVGEAPFIVYIGYYRDTFVQENGQWRFKEKVINRWNNTTSPPIAAPSR
jgi:SnoaL-like domain